jgi:hypothetical protein
MLGWKLAFNNLSLMFSDKPNKKNDQIILQEFIFLSDIFLFLFLPVGFKLGELLNFTVCIFASLVIRIISIGMLIIFFFVDNNIMILISLSLFNIGYTISCLKSVQNCCKFFMKNFGLVYAVYFSGSSFGSFIFTYLGKFIIKKDDSFIKNNIYLYISGSMALLFGFLEMASSKIYRELKGYKKYKKEKNNNSISLSMENNDITEPLEEMISDYDLSREKSYSSLILFKINIKKALISKINIQLIYIYICDFCKSIYLLNIYMI